MVVKFINTEKYNQSYEDELQVLLDITWFDLERMSFYIDHGVSRSYRTCGLYGKKYKNF